MGYTKPQEQKSWHREPWPWVIIGLLGTTGIAGSGSVGSAVSNPDFLVVEESEYQQIKSELRAQSGDKEAKPDPGDG